MVDVKKQQTAMYIRLSRDDSEKIESESVLNQKLLLSEYIAKQEDLILFDTYIDDGYTGTNFDRPEYKRLIEDIESKKIECVIVKDMSRLGRNLAKTTELMTDYFPSKKVRFIAINDNIDKKFNQISDDDMMIDFKNVFNSFYPRDISKKVRSTLDSKRKDGQFIGAFACYGYKKSDYDKNKLIIDEEASNIVRRIFNMYISGVGQNTIAKILNDEGLPCPSVYKKQLGLNYKNSCFIGTSGWSYATIHKMLINEMYIGNMVQKKVFRQPCKRKAFSQSKENWIIVKDTHEAIIDKATFKKVQELLTKKTKQINFNENIHIFAGFLKCGDCDHSMAKLKRASGIAFNCGNYNRHGKKYCTMHAISELELQTIILNDLNVILKSISDINEIVEEEQKKAKTSSNSLVDNLEKLKQELKKLELKKEQAYIDYSDKIISREEYIKYSDKFEEDIKKLNKKMSDINETLANNEKPKNSFIAKLLDYGTISKLTREIVVEMIDFIYIFEDKRIKIVYNFSDELETLLD